jgi:eukaryotic-like serine/threonine-protein kinase
MNPPQPGRPATAPEPSASWSQDDPRVAVALEEYLDLLKAGRRPSREEFLARHAAIAEALADCLDGLELVQSAARELPAPDPPVTAEEALPPSTCLGDFRIVREVGRGGMGIVYEAQQVSLGRRVALKVLPYAAALDPRHLQRFQVEAQAAAHLHHAHIVPVFAVGSDRGVHYYAMQFIDGRTLAAVVRELRHRAERPSGSGADELGLAEGPGPAKPPAAEPPSTIDAGTAFPDDDDRGSSSDRSASRGGAHRGRAFFRTAARLGVQAAEALEHAHALGVVHRDIKPSNLMLDAKGALWVTDFGLARFQDDSELTRTGDVMGTLRYMSPEQARARRAVVDHRTDIYSLGVTLYELLTLRPAFDGRDRHELLRRIAEEEPAAPRKINPAVPRDLETIVLKAMAKEVAGRYASAQELADDLRRFLDDQPIRARRPTLLAHAAKWTRRHRAAVVSAATVLALAVAVGTTLLWGAYQREQGMRIREREAVRDAVKFTDDLAINAMGMLSRLTAEQNTDRVWFYPKALGYYEKIARLYQDDPEMRTVVARAYQRIGFVRMILRDHYHSLPPSADVEGSYRRSIAFYEAELAARPDQRQVIWDLAYVLREFRGVLSHTRQWPQVLECSRRVVDLDRRYAALAPADFDARMQQLDDQAQLGLVLAQVGQPGEAAQVSRQVVELGSALAAESAGAADRRAAVVQILNNVGQSFASRGWRRDAEQLYRQALGVAPDSPLTLNNLAWLLVTRPGDPPDDPPLAVALAKKALDFTSRVGRPQPRDIWNTLGVAYFRLGDDQAAAEALETSMKLHGRGGDANDWFVLAMIRWRQGERSEARQLFERSAKWRRDNLPQDPDLLHFENEAASLLGMGRPKPSPPRPKAPPATPKPRRGPLPATPTPLDDRTPQ